LRSIIEELSQHYQNLKNENEQNKKNLTKTSQEKEESIENVKRQYERQKQKDLETIREYIQKVFFIFSIKHFKLKTILIY
jgi:hypothetical protein